MAKCKFCGETGLIWDCNPETGVNRLRTVGWEPHVCPNYKPKAPVCNRCGYDKLQWREIEGRWVLYDGDLPHDCGEGAPPWAHSNGTQSGKAVACRRCGAPGLKWGQDRYGKSVLFDGKYPHDCGEGLPGYLREQEPVARPQDSLPDL